MKTIWCFEGPDYWTFEDESLILPSIRLSYSAHRDVKVTELKGRADMKEFLVESSAVSQVLRFRRYVISDEVTHL